MGNQNPPSAHRLTRLCRDSFVRTFDCAGYIANQLTRHDRAYDESGAVFLSALSRTPQSIQDIASTVAASFVDIRPEDITKDVAEFLSDLEADLFVVSGSSPAEIDSKEPSFKYGTNPINFKTRTRSFLDPQHEPWLQDTQSYFESRFKGRPRLVELQMEVTSACNEKCRHCYFPDDRINHVQPRERVLRILDQFAAMGGLSTTFSGGEPLLHPDIIDFWRHARKLDLSFAVLSNLTLLSSEHIDGLVETNPSQVQVSVYSTDPAEHDHITRLQGSHKKTLQSIDALVDANIQVTISCPVMKANLRHAPAVVEWAYARGMKVSLDFIMMGRSDFSTDNLDERLSQDETAALIRELIVVDDAYRDQLDESAERITKSLPDPRRPEISVCGVGRSFICMSANGVFYPCPGWQGMPVGHADESDLRDLWENSPQLNKLRNTTWSAFPECLQCEYFDFCSMCFVRNFNESGGDMLKINEHFCDVAKQNKRLVDEHLRKTQGAVKARG